MGQACSGTDLAPEPRDDPPHGLTSSGADDSVPLRGVLPPQLMFSFAFELVALTFMRANMANGGLTWPGYPPWELHAEGRSMEENERVWGRVISPPS